MKYLIKILHSRSQDDVILGARCYKIQVLNPPEKWKKKQFRQLPVYLWFPSSTSTPVFSDSIHLFGDMVFKINKNFIYGKFISEPSVFSPNYVVYGLRF